MNKADYRKALQAARIEFERLLRERVELDQRIVRLKQTIVGLTGLCDGNGAAPHVLNNAVPLAPRFMRLTSAIRQVLADSVSPMRPPDMRRALVEHGLSMMQYSNKLAVIHNTLSRLERQGEVTEVSSGWTLTEKGRLASRIDSLGFVPTGQPEGASGNGHSDPAKAESEGNGDGLHRTKRARRGIRL
jgi:hypothetical protein